MLRQREDLEARLARIRATEKAQKQKYLKGGQDFKKRRVDAAKNSEDGADEEKFVLEDYDSDGENSSSKNMSTPGVLSTATLELMEKLGMGIQVKEEDTEVEDEIKVSRLACRW
jgi:chromosome transmission fidelity protein 1